MKGSYWTGCVPSKKCKCSRGLRKLLNSDTNLVCFGNIPCFSRHDVNTYEKIMVTHGPNYRARHLPHTTAPLLLRFPKCALHVASPQSWHPWWQSAQSGLLHVWHASENWPLPESFLQSVHTSPMECDGRIWYKDQTAWVSRVSAGIIRYLERRRARI